MPAQRLIVCADGTWNRPDPRPGVERTNAARIAQTLAPQDAKGVRQVVFYLPGIGTRGPFDVHAKAYTGHGLGAKIQQAYLFLAHNWAEGDEIWLFGVSRGAFVVRAVSQWIDRCGLLAPEQLGGLRGSWKAYRRQEPAATPGRRAPIRFIGAFDMVDALGIPIPGVRGLSRPPVGPSDPTLPGNVTAAFHALSFDERRKAFRPTIWSVPAGDSRRVEQQWFAGAHGDVCGGFGKRGLSDVPLGWMAQRAREAGLAFDEPRFEAEMQPDLSLQPSRQRAGLHLLLPSVERRPLQASPATESFHQSWVRKVRDPNDPYGGELAARFVRGEGALSE